MQRHSVLLFEINLFDIEFLNQLLPLSVKINHLCQHTFQYHSCINLFKNKRDRINVNIYICIFYYLPKIIFDTSVKVAV